MQRVYVPRVWALVLPLLFVPDLGLSVTTPMGVIEPSDFALILLYPALVLGSAGPSGLPGAVKWLFWLFVASATLSTLLPYASSAGADDAVVHAMFFGLFKISKLAAYALLGYFVARAVRSEADVARCFRGLGVGALIMAGSIVATALTCWTMEMLLVRKNLFPYKAVNPLSVGMAALGVFFAAAPRQEGGFLGAAFRRAVLLALFAAMFLTGGRGGWFAGLVGFAYLLGVRGGWRSLLGAAALVLVGLSVITVAPPVRGHALKLIGVRSEGEAVRNDSNRYAVYDEGRLKSWAHEGAKFRNAPVFGVGFYNRGATSGLWTTGSHNFFIQMALETGVVGFMTLLALFWMVWRSVPRRGSPDAPGVVYGHNLALRAALVAICAGSMTGEYLYGGFLLGLLSVLYGAVVAQQRVATLGNGIDRA